MNITITFRQIPSSEAIKNYALEKMGKLQRFMRQPISGEIVLSCQNHRVHRAEMVIQSGGEHYNAHGASKDMYASIDSVIAKLERQITDGKAVSESKRKGAERASERLMRVG